MLFCITFFYFKRIIYTKCIYGDWNTIREEICIYMAKEAKLKAGECPALSLLLLFMKACHRYRLKEFDVIPVFIPQLFTMEGNERRVLRDEKLHKRFLCFLLSRRI